MTVSTVEKRRRRTTAVPAKRAASSRGWIWAVVQIAALAGEIFIVLFLLAQPAFRPQQVQVSGLRHLTAAQVRSALGLPGDRRAPVHQGSKDVEEQGFGVGCGGVHGGKSNPKTCQKNAPNRPPKQWLSH